MNLYEFIVLIIPVIIIPLIIILMLIYHYNSLIIELIIYSVSLPLIIPLIFQITVVCQPDFRDSWGLLGYRQFKTSLELVKIPGRIDILYPLVS